MILKSMKKYLYQVTAAACLAFVFMTGEGQAAQQYQGLCSYVKIEILQELTMERVGFLATLEVTNNEGDASITDFSAALTFGMDAGDGTITDASHLFFVQPAAQHRMAGNTRLAHSLPVQYMEWRYPRMYSVSSLIPLQ